jgi:hypothetical protein
MFRLSCHNITSSGEAVSMQSLRAATDELSRYTQPTKHDQSDLMLVIPYILVVKVIIVPN